jgi:hypothetical protein
MTGLYAIEVEPEVRDWLGPAHDTFDREVT